MAFKKGVIQKIEEKRMPFVFAFLVLFALTFSFLSFVGATPDSPSTISEQVQETPTPAQKVAAPIVNPGTTAPLGMGDLPTRVVAKSIGINVAVSNPASSDIATLDDALLHGGVRYPTSARLGENGTVLLFGHSSYLPIVHNQAYKAFDGIQNLKNGDIISVYGGNTIYNYQVTGVKKADATSDVVELPSDAEYLTLVTCDSFATKSNRFIVTAAFIGSEIGN